MYYTHIQLTYQSESSVSQLVHHSFLLHIKPSFIKYTLHVHVCVMCIYKLMSTISDAHIIITSLVGQKGREHLGNHLGDLLLIQFGSAQNRADRSNSLDRMG